jgi:hypothetical protein
MRALMTGLITWSTPLPDAVHAVLFVSLSVM